MAKDDFDDFDEEDIEEDKEEEEPQPQKQGRGRPPKPIPAGFKKKEEPRDQPRTQRESEREQKVDVYSSYHYPERHGIKNDETNQVVSEDVMDVLSIILNKLERIERSTG